MQLKIVLLFLICPSGLLGQIHERWDVKTLTDGTKLDLKKIASVTTYIIDTRKIDIVGKTTSRLLPLETHVVKLTGRIVRKTLEGDGDYHVELADATSRSSVVCEFVDPANTVAKNSPYISYFRASRLKIAQYRLGDTITVIGVLFQDMRHGRPSPLRTRNYLEVHPVLFCK
jgi:hypothetical protein